MLFFEHTAHFVEVESLAHFAVPLDPVTQKPSTVFSVTFGPPHIVKVTESKCPLYVLGFIDGSLPAATSAPPRSNFESQSNSNPEISSEDAAPLPL